MSALIIGEKQRSAITEMRAFAAADPLDPASVMRTAEKDMGALRGFMGTLSIELPVGYFVTYSHERQPFGLAQHISVSVNRPHKAPSVEAVEMILEEFGMQPLRGSVSVWIEEVNRTTKAINILQAVPHHAAS